ncbi:hypothetical protein EK21DRAFT_94223 [Setomelanomma holmii]|uniref:DUF7730 domain-containing protein n=1 Tax=Setomelanomma holmii TaxID=210430 RepID=A0A9P4GYH3_9PLEO|nr:hypothetical protein EK21DRAFT_94223 [Setomelanomma holmii]
MEPTMNSQHKRSPVLNAPYDIRRAILLNLLPQEIHIYIDHYTKRLCMTPCVLRKCPGSDQDTGFDRRDTGKFDNDPMWAKRLNSSWGPHWTCEEVAQSELRDIKGVKKSCYAFLALMRMCKQMFNDIVDLLRHETTFYVTDFRILDSLTTPGILWKIRRLSLIIRLPLLLCKAMEDMEEARIANASTPAFSEERIELGMRTIAWMKVSSPLTRLQKLRILDIWIDHNDKQSWSIIHERAVLRPLEPLLEVPELQMVINLPKLHPRWEMKSKGWFYGEDGKPSRFRICRRRRQEFHAEKDELDRLTCVTLEADFPSMRDWPEFEGLTEEELEEKEGRLWREGKLGHVSPRQWPDNETLESSIRFRPSFASNV